MNRRSILSLALTAMLASCAAPGPQKKVGDSLVPNSTPNFGAAQIDAKWQKYETYLRRLIDTVQIPWERHTTSTEVAVRACLNAITDRSPFGVWSDAMKAALGSQQEVTFSSHY